MHHSEARHPTLRTTLLAAAAFVLFPLAASAADVPPTPEGAQKLVGLFATYLGKSVAGASSPLSVTPEGGHYVVSFDAALFAAPFAAAGVSIDPAVIKYELTEQDDGTWHVVCGDLPAISVHNKDSAFSYNFDGYGFDGIFDPALGAFKSAQAKDAKLTAHVQAPGLEEKIVVGEVRAALAGLPAPNGAASLAIHEQIGDFSLQATVTPGGAKAAPDATATPVALDAKGANIDLGLDGLSPRKLLGLWAFAVSHPSRAEIAANEPAFKDLLRGLLPGEAKLAEKVDMQKLTVDTPKGAFGATGGKFGFSASTAPGPKAAFEYHFAADGVSLPPGLVPSPFQTLVPNRFDFSIKANGFDFGAAVEEAINDMHFAGDDKIISEADGAKILAKLKGDGPLVVELTPSHVGAPQIDLTVEGEAHLDTAGPNGTLKVHLRNFDNTVAAIKGLGPLATPQLLGGLTMARTLAKTESDGALTWVVVYDADGALKINGLPLGKPFGSGQPKLNP